MADLVIHARYAKKLSLELSSMWEQEKRCRKGSSVDVTLLPDIWSDLPPELVERVVLKLPFLSLVNLRRVCKKWNETVLSACVQAPKSVPIKSYPGDFASKLLTVYNPTSRTWEKHSLSFVGGTQGSYALVASDGGLLCFSDSTFSTFVVCNPLTKSWKKHSAPRPLVPRHRPCVVSGIRRTKRWAANYTLVGMCVDPQTGSYKLVVAGLRSQRDSPPSTALVFDSLSESWEDGASVCLPQQQIAKWYCQNDGRSVACNGALYWLLAARSSVAVAKFNLRDGTWSVTEVMRVRRGGNLVVHNGKVCVMTVDFRRLRDWNYKLLELCDSCSGKQSGMRLEEKEMPKFLLDEIRQNEKTEQVYRFQHHSCVGHASVLFVPSMVRHKEQVVGWKLLIFDSFKDECTWLPLLEGKGRYSFEEEAGSWWELVPDEEARSWWAFLPTLRPFP